jgi:nicotinamidase-related amidase
MSVALLVIDVQEALFTPKPALADPVVARINALAARARQAGVPVFFIQHETKAEPLRQGSPGWALYHGLEFKQGDQTVFKTTPDSYLGTGLDERLRQAGVATVVICGYATEFCVDTTTRRSAALGYDVMLVADGHTTHDKAHADAAQIVAHHNATLPDITSFGPKIRAVPAAEVRF